MKDKLHLAIDKNWLGKELTENAERDILAGIHEHLGKYVKERNIDIKISLVDSPAKVVIALMGSAHKWHPDFVTTWSIEADMSHMLAALATEDIDPAYVFSDPSIPKKYKFFNFRKDEPYKTKADGSRSTKAFSELWHTVTCPASFTFVCAMASYRALRTRDQQRSDWKLDGILHDELNLGKLKFKSVPPEVSGVDWHIEMQTKHRIEYMVYLAFDGISVELLNEKTKDLSYTLRGAAGVSEISKFKSNPKRLADDNHFELLKNGKVIGSTSSDMKDEFDELTPSLKNWIIALASELEFEMGVTIIDEFPLLETNVTTHASDTDVTSAYPSTGIAFNASKTTRLFELCKAANLSIDDTRSIGINITSVNSNALSLARMCYGFPDLASQLAAFKKEKGLAV